MKKKDLAKLQPKPSRGLLYAIGAAGIIGGIATIWCARDGVFTTDIDIDNEFDSVCHCPTETEQIEPNDPATIQELLDRD